MFDRLQKVGDFVISRMTVKLSFSANSARSNKMHQIMQDRINNARLSAIRLQAKASAIAASNPEEADRCMDEASLFLADVDNLTTLA